MPAPWRFSFVTDSVPHLRKPGALRRPRSVPYLQRNTANECGLAGFAATLGLHGRALPVRGLVDAYRFGLAAESYREFLEFPEPAATTTAPGPSPSSGD